MYNPSILKNKNKNTNKNIKTINGEKMNHTIVPIVSDMEIQEYKVIKSFSESSKEQQILIMRVISAMTCKPMNDIDKNKIEALFQEVKKFILNNK